MNQEFWIGIALCFLAGVLGFLLLLCLVPESREIPLYLKELPQVFYSPDTMKLLWDCYQVSRTPEGMLTMAAERSGDRRVRKRLDASVSYLKESRYKDYETALYVYASDGSSACRELFEKVLQTEMRKRQGLPQKGR